MLIVLLSTQLYLTTAFLLQSNLTLQILLLLLH